MMEIAFVYPNQYHIVETLQHTTVKHRSYVLEGTGEKKVLYGLT